MELDELKKLWHSQDKKELYTINMQAMNDHIQRKKAKTIHIINLSEWSLIIVNFAAGLFLIVLNKRQPPAEIFMYLLGAWMLGSSLYALVFRIIRTMAKNKFDRSVRSDLDYAVFTATYQVRLSRVMRWNVVPIAMFTVLGMWESGKPIWYGVAIAAFFALAFYVSSWEHNVYVNRKTDLERLRDKLLQGDSLS